MRQTIGDKIISRLEGFTTALKQGEKLEGRFNSRTVELDLEPRSYGSEEVKSVRKILGVSQSIFAKFLGVKVKTVQSWEQQTVSPPGMARRFMDEISLNPSLWKKRLEQSIVFKDAVKPARPGKPVKLSSNRQ